MPSVYSRPHTTNGDLGSLRVVHLITSLDVGGAERMLAKLVHSMDRHEFEPSVVTLSDDGLIAEHIRSLGIEVQSAGLRRGQFNPIALKQLVSILHDCQPDLIQSWMYHSNVAASLTRPWLARTTGIIWNIRQSLYSLSKERYLTQAVIRSGVVLAPHADAIVNNSQVSLAQHAAFGYENRRQLVIPNGFELEQFRPNSAARDAFRAQLGIGERAIVVGIVARVHPDKDHAMFFRAAEIAARRDERLLFVCVGRDTDSNEQFTSAMNGPLKGRLHLLGLREDVPSIMAGFDLAISSSWTEGCPNSIGESMACGLAVIGTDAGDTAAVIGDAGSVVARGDHGKMAEAILAYAALTATERRMLGDAARDRIRTRYSIESIAASYSALYREIYRERQGHLQRKRSAKSAKQHGAAHNPVTVH